MTMDKQNIITEQLIKRAAYLELDFFGVAFLTLHLWFLYYFLVKSSCVLSLNFSFQ